MRRRVLLLLSLASVISVIWPVHAAEVSVKSLSGPPEEIATHRLPSAKETGVPSSLLVLDRGTRKPGDKVTSGTTYSSFSASPGVGFSLVQVTTQYPYFAPAAFTAPDGRRYEFNGSSITCSYGFCGEYQADLQMEAFTGSSGGVAILSVSGGEVSGGTWELAVQDPTEPLLRGSVPLQIETVLSFDDNMVEVEIDPDPCSSRARICPAPMPAGQRRSAPFDLVDGAAPVLRLSFVDRDLKSKGLQKGIGLAALRVTVTDARTRMTFYQEQLTPSRLAGLPVDGTASLVQLPALPVGEYSVRLDIEGNVEGVGHIERTGLYYLPIIARSYKLTGEVRSEVVDKERLKLVLDLDPSAENSRHVYAYAEVWTKDGKKPIAWIGGMTQPEPGRSGRLGLPVLLDARWLALAEAKEMDYLLRNVRIQDPDTFIPIDQIAELPFTVGELPGTALLAKDSVVMDDSLYVGKGDRTISVDDAETAIPPRDKFSNTGIFLVHGWCSNWATWPSTHFGRPGRIGGTELFNDPDASRSHDAFARQIRDQGAANFANSFTVVAHSQGGAAAVHLRSFYNSLLDLSTAPRRIQTMGTPYGGSTLMDYYLATGPLGWLIAEIFGACTAQFDLGTVGSALWSSNIPSWARGDVYFYRTGYRRPHTFWQSLQFWRWHCGVASFAIPLWDDGVVATFQGWFSGAHDMGITEGECHTGNRNGQIDQTDNYDRNDILDREGRPNAANLARSATASASSTYTPGCSPGVHCYFPWRVNDGDRSTTLGGNTSWANDNGQPMPQWVQLHWPAAITFSRVNLWLTAGYEASSFRIEYRASASSAWQVLAAVTGNTASVLGPYNVPFPGTATAQDIRILGLSGPAIQPGYIRVNEIEVY